jgi:predicted dehydrogenase
VEVLYDILVILGPNRAGVLGHGYKLLKGKEMSQPKKVTRRGFMKGAAGALAFPYFVPSSALGRGNWIAPSERITLGFLGIGNMGGNHLRSYVGNSQLDKQVQILAVCDVDTVKRQRARKIVEDNYAKMRGGQYKGCDEYNEFEKLMARQDVDAIVMAPPDHWHTIIAIAAMRSGKDVYCEKPMTLTIKEARELVKAARRYGRVFQTGSQQRSSSNFRLGCELVRSGRIGKLETVYVGIGGPSSERYLPEQPVPEGFDWDRWLGPAPWQPYNSERCSGNYGGGWRLIRDYSGGMMTDWGAHHFDIAQWGMGMDGSGPVEIIPPDGKDYKNLTYKYVNGVTMYRGSANGIEPRGVRFVGRDGQVEVSRGHFKTWPASIGQEPLGPNDVHLYDSPNHRQDWLNCIRSRQRPICDVAVGASSVTVCHLGNIAYWTGRRLKWDPAKGQIIGDEEASRWLDRPKRAPWRL